MKAGGAYVALDASLPRERLAYMLADSGAALVLAGRAEAALLGDTPGVACLVPDDAALARHGDGDMPPRCHPDSLAYIIYTSGSTGRPKGTLNLHRGPCNRIDAMQRQFGLCAADVVLQKTPLTFDVSVWELFWTLGRGATLALAAPEAHKDPAWLAHAIRHHGVTVIHFVPSMLHMFLAGRARGPFPTLRYLMTSGEALSVELQERCISGFPGVELINHYGPTEAGIEVSWWRFNAVRADRLVPIGAPIANVRLHILDADDRPAPVGVTGELHIAGIQVGEGYLNQPALTAERFVTREVMGRRERLYRTGDRARWLPDGQIAYVGRLDNQVKLFGVRVELGDIESHVRAQPQVADAVVAVYGEHAAQRLACYVVAADEPEDEAAFVATLRAALAQCLPANLLQSCVFMPLAALPLSPNGKVDRQALPAPLAAPAARRTVAQPDSALAGALRALWSRHLQLAPDAISVHDNFFEIGGNSLLSIALQTDIKDSLGRDIAVTDIFRHPTIAQLCRHLGAADAAAPALAAAAAPDPGRRAGAMARALQARSRSAPGR